MQPHALNQETFRSYPPLAKEMACKHLALLRDLPVPLAAILLRELITFDECLPAERAAIKAQFSFLASLSVDQRHRWTEGFDHLSLPPQLVAQDWARFPREFEAELSTHLWSSHQIDAFHAAGALFAEGVQKAFPPARPPIPRWIAVIVDSDLRKEGHPLFRKLRREGVFFSHVEGNDGTAAILNHLADRSRETTVPYGHWYIDGGSPLSLQTSAVNLLSWHDSSALRNTILHKAQAVIGSGAAGPDMLHSIMASWAPDSKMSSAQEATGDPLLDRLLLKIYGEGSGTQIFSTTFVQWATREVLRRAEPLSLVARFGPRQGLPALKDTLTDSPGPTKIDCEGSLIDADLAAYYTWVNLNRLQGFEESRFLAWSEAYRQAVAIGPGLPRGAHASEPIALDRVLHLVA
jgi:hypothetical protein